ncbi:MAG: ribonuclease R [Syntrophomonadaceae bacterium]|jgi:ribonuclease R|nr:ribonuclease R [Syntrophomonadaceae bacterium]
MVSKESVLKIMRETDYKPMGYNELGSELGIENEKDKQALTKILNIMEKEGYIIKTRKNKYGLPEMMHLRKGVIHINKKGYGILIPDEAGQGEVFIYGKKLNGAMHNDRVIVRLYGRKAVKQRPEGSVIRIIKRANSQLVGTFKRKQRHAVVIPDDSRQLYPIFIRTSRKQKIENGDKVLVKIIGWPDEHNDIEGKIIEILGKKGEPGMDFKLLVKKHALRTDFPPDVLEEAKNLAKAPFSNLNGRKDLRSLNIVTIDGEDAKDLDDAVSVSRIKGGFRLGVHIADVSHYVTEGSKLDKEAGQRSTSVYLVNHVLPMLPPELSNGICSLNVSEDRLAVSCVMDINPQGEIIKYELFKSIINVRERMTYTDVNKILANCFPDLQERYAEQIDDFLIMAELAAILRKRRQQRGALDFDFPETKIEVDEDGSPVKVSAFKRGPAEMLIEDFMIQANEVVAEHLFKKQLPALYRIHEKPDTEALPKLNQILGVFGHKTSHMDLTPRDYQNILKQVQGRPEEQLISIVLLRSMKHARYSPQLLGHFGLASQYYCHFTSPIRRYPDLLVHRVLSHLLAGKLSDKKKNNLKKQTSFYGEYSTTQEMKAEEAEREYVDIKKAEYMRQYIGEEFQGTISSIQTFGFFVRLENTIEGLVHISALYDDYYVYNETNYTLCGSHNGCKFAIGDRVNVLVSQVNAEEAKIDFELTYMLKTLPSLTKKNSKRIM